MNLIGEGSGYTPPIEPQPLPKDVAETIGTRFAANELPDGHEDKKPAKRITRKRLVVGTLIAFGALKMCSAGGGSGEQNVSQPETTASVLIAPDEEAVVRTVPVVEAPTTTAPKPVPTELSIAPTTTVPTTTAPPAPPTTAPAPKPPAAVGKLFHCQDAVSLSQLTGKTVQEGQSYVRLELVHSGMPPVQNEAFSELTTVVVQMNGGNPQLSRGADPVLLTGCAPN